MTLNPYQVADISLETTVEIPGNPFMVEVEGRFDGPAGRTLRVPGFYRGGRTWTVRFSPPAEGTWRYVIRCPELADIDRSEGTIECERAEPGPPQAAPSTAAAPVSPPTGNSRERGVLRVSRSHPMHFQFEDGTFFFMNAYECDWLWALDLGTDGISKTEALIRQTAGYGFNTVLMNVYAHDTGWAPGTTSEHDYGPPAMYPWEGSNDEPDHSRLNLRFFDHLDSVVRLLSEHGMVLHLYLKVYNKKVRWPERYSPEEDLYFRTVVARFGAFWNIIWDFSKESYNESDKDYLYSRLCYIRSLDAYRHMVTTHDDHKYLETRLHRGSVDFYTAQQHTDYYESAISTKARYGMPYFNSEFGYEHGPGGPDDYTYGVRQSPEELIWRAWEVCMAGAYPAYYYTYTAWDVVDFRYKPPGYRYFETLYEFFSSIRFWEFEPTFAFCRPRTARVLARGAEEYVVFHHARDRGSGLVTEGVDLEGYEGYWLDIYSGTRIALSDEHRTKRADTGLWRISLPPEWNTGVLHLKRA